MDHKASIALARLRAIGRYFDPLCCSRLGVLRGEPQQYVESPIGIPDTFDLMLDNAPARRCRVTWRKATQIGVEFA
jgi:hypothetical protein